MSYTRRSIRTAFQRTHAVALAFHRSCWHSKADHRQRLCTETRTVAHERQTTLSFTCVILVWRFTAFAQDIRSKSRKSERAAKLLIAERGPLGPLMPREIAENLFYCTSFHSIPTLRANWINARKSGNAVAYFTFSQILLMNFARTGRISTTNVKPIALTVCVQPQQSITAPQIGYSNSKRNVCAAVTVLRLLVSPPVRYLSLSMSRISINQFRRLSDTLTHT